MKQILFGCTGGIVLMLLVTYAVSAGDKTAPNEVAIDNFSFDPQTLIVAVGAKVTWTNHDDVPHTIVSTDKKTFMSSALDTDEKFAHTFSAPGTNDYYCSVHPHMRGRIIVQ